MNWKENWFNVFVKNKWDLGWPCSTRLMFWLVAIFGLLIAIGIFILMAYNVKCKVRCTTNLI